jgi:CubicO group peptidase (beta-lactamase class C family)
MDMSRTKSIEKIFQRTVRNSKIHEAVLFVENTSGEFSYSCGYGGKNIDTPLAAASITKLFTTACILILQEQEKLSFEDKLTKYFGHSILSGLHIYKSQEYSYEFTIYDLLFQTSGLPNAYEETRNSIKKRIIDEDAYISFDEMIKITKNLKPRFAPRTKKRAHYADINFDILGEIIEQITGLPLEQVYKKMIFDPLGLMNTYLPINEHEFIPKIYYKDKLLDRPKFIMCSRASGGCISTARELMVFIKAFFGGKLFSSDVLNKLCSYHKMQVSMSPIRYGSGYMQIPLGGISTFFQGRGELVGHSGSTGSLAFYHPDKDLFFVGDVNQMANPAIPVRLTMQLAIIIN